MNAFTHVYIYIYSHLQLHLVEEISDKLLEVLHKAHKADKEKLAYLVNKERKAKMELKGYLVLLEGKEKEVLWELEALRVLPAMLLAIKANKGNRVLLVLKVFRANVRL